MIELNQLTVSGNVYDIVTFYMTNSGQYAIFSIILFILGWLLQNQYIEQKNNREPVVITKAEVDDNSTDEEEDFEVWFRNNEQ